MTTYELTLSTNDLGLGVLNSARTRIEKRRVSIADTYPPINNLVKIEKPTNNLGVAIFLLEPDDLTTYHVAKVFDSAGIPVYEKSFTMPPSAVNLHDSYISVAIGGSLIQFKENGNNLGTPTTVRNVDIVGIGADATFAGDTVTIDVTKALALKVNNSAIGNPSGVAPLDENSNVPEKYLSFTQTGTGAVATTVQDALRNALSVWDFMTAEMRLDALLNAPVLNHAPAFQAAINDAITRGIRRIFVPFGRRQRYRLESTVVIGSSGFSICGDVAPIYSPENGGYIFAPASVTSLFDYGNGQSSYGSNQFVADGVAFYSSTGLTQTAIKFTQNNNGPHRGFLLRNCAGKGFLNIALFDVPTESNLSVATVDVQSCVFSGNTNTVNAVERAFGLRYVGNQSEQGARITGFWDSGITITDNMLEGQTNPINIDSNSPTVSIRNNYFEAISGDYVVRVKGTNSNSTLDVQPNYVSNILSTDVFLVENVIRLHESNLMTVPSTRKALITALQAYIACGSDISGNLYTATSTTDGGVAGFTNPVRMAGVLPSTAVLKQDLGSVSMQTPFGDTKTGVSVNGFPGTYYSLTKSWFSGDVLICCALVRVESGEQPYFNIYNESYSQPGVSVGQQTISPIHNSGWFLMFSARATTVGGTTCRFRFGSNGTGAGTKSLHIAAIGVDVVAAADFETFNSVGRAFVRLFNPFIPNKSIEASTTYDPPSLTTGSGESVVLGVAGVALGDYVEVSFDQPLQGVTLTAFVNNPSQVAARFQNQTGSTINLASGTLRFRVRKA